MHGIRMFDKLIMWATDHYIGMFPFSIFAKEANLYYLEESDFMSNIWESHLYLNQFHKGWNSSKSSFCLKYFDIPKN
jgi:hypothetical protein